MLVLTPAFSNVSWLPHVKAASREQTSDPELDESSEHLAASNLKGGAASGALDEEGVVVGLQEEVPTSARRFRKTRNRHVQ